MKINKLTSGELSRWVSVTVLLSVLLLSLLLQSLSLMGAIGAVAAACGILTLVPSADSAAPFSRRWILVQACLALSVPPAVVLLGPDWCAPAWACAVLGPAAVGMTRHGFHLAADQEFLSRNLSGWEYLLALSKKTFLLWTTVLLAFAWAGSSVGGLSAKVFSLFSLVALSALLLILLARSLTVQSLLSSGFESGVMGKGRNRPFLRPSPASRHRAGDRLWFDKTCQFMETSKAYLNGSFSQDDAARGVGTNKSYLSNVINAYAGMSFPRFVNSYRIQYAMELFRRDPKLKVSEMSMMSGFNQDVTFTEAFKYFVGKKPSDWCREWRDQVESSK
ncbi:MAG: AraC family transcriptional regulator [Bacteroidales bacterium]|nr:AraC family transcriptional regulator [Bacteroidales bacterium]